MAKISKNIKRLRNEKNITQDILAEKLNISRQAVSSWENDRTQPDVDMLEKLSEIFGVSIEELIYGKKRNTTLELEKTNYNSTITIVFSILGALLVGVGLVLIFVTVWEDMPIFFKGLLSFVPLLAGQASGLFVLYKKKDKIPWCEGGSVLWTAGIAATLTLIYNIFDLSIDWTSVLILVTLSVLPVILLLRSVAPTVVYYATAIAWGFINMEENDSLFALFATVLLVSIGCIFNAYLIKTEKKSHRSIASQWISVFAVATFMMLLGIGIDGNIVLGLVGLMTVFICLYMLSLKDGDMAMPYKIPGLLGSALVMFINSSLYFDNLVADKYNVTYIAVCVSALIAVAFATKLKTKDKFSLGYISVVCIAYAISIFSLYAMGEDYDSDMADMFITILKAPALAGYILMIISGGREKKLVPINIGFIGVSAMTMLIIAQSELSMLGNGIMLLVFGGILLTINFKITKAKQKIPATENNKEVQSDEK